MPQKSQVTSHRPEKKWLTTRRCYCAHNCRKMNITINRQQMLLLKLLQLGMRGSFEDTSAMAVASYL